MFLSIKEMEIRRVRFDESFEPGAIDFSEAGLTQATPLRTNGVATLLENTGGEVRVQGRFQVEMEAECDRCLAAVRYPLDLAFDLFYRPVPVGGRPEEEVEIDEGEAEIAFYRGDGFELADVMREQVLLALPMQRVCREDCQGICPHCGVNRNETPCECRARVTDDRWSALRGYYRSREG